MAQPPSCPHFDASFVHGVSPTHAAGGRRCPFSGVQSTAAATAFAATSDAIVSTDATGRILASNNGAEAMFGLTSDELMRCRVHDILTSCAQASPKRSEHALFGFMPGSKNRTTMTGSRKDGTTFPCDVTSTVSDSGEAVFIVRNNQFEAGISSALSQVANPDAGTVIVTVSGGPVCEDDPGECPALGEVVSITGNVAAMLGYTAEELVGHNVKGLCPEPHRSLHDMYIARYLATGVKLVLGTARVVSAVHKDGSLVRACVHFAEAPPLPSNRRKFHMFVAVLRPYVPTQVPAPDAPHIKVTPGPESGAEAGTGTGTDADAESGSTSPPVPNVEYDTPADEATAAIHVLSHAATSAKQRDAIDTIRRVLALKHPWSPSPKTLLRRLSAAHLDPTTRKYIIGSLSGEARRSTGDQERRLSGAATPHGGGRRRLSRLQRMMSDPKSPLRSSIQAHINVELMVAETGSRYDTFDVLALEREAPGCVFSSYVMHPFRQHRMARGLCGISSHTLRAFGAMIDDGYRPRADVPFHNATHATSVLHAAHVFVSSKRVLPFVSPRQVVALLVAASIHDYDHPGVNNLYLVNSEHELAIQHNDQAVLERHHASAAFMAMKADGGKADVLSGLARDDRNYVRRLIISLVLATDMDRHLDHLGSMKAVLHSVTTTIMSMELAHHGTSEADCYCSASSPRRPPALASFHSTSGAGAGAGAGNSNPLPVDVEITPATSPWEVCHASREQMPSQYVEVMLRTIIKAADIAHPTQSWLRHRELSRRIQLEFFHQGDLEKEADLPVSPLCDRDSTKVYAAQVGFLDFVVAPFFQTATFVFGDQPDPLQEVPLLKQLSRNRQHWRVLSKSDVPQAAFFGEADPLEMLGDDRRSATTPTEAPAQ